MIRDTAMPNGLQSLNSLRPRTVVVVACVLTLLAACTTAQRRADGIHELTILQLNDVYEILPVPVQADSGEVLQGGMANVATAIAKHRAGGHVLLLHAGDMFSPSLLSGKLKHRGAQMVEALNLLGLDAATFGNHEFDFGCRVFVDRVREANFPWVAANVILPPGLDIPPGKLRDVLVVKRAGLRVGIFGLALPIQPIGGCSEGPITFEDPVHAARRSVTKLREEAVDLVIGLTHLRMEQDRALAAAVPGIDVIIGGHEHEVLESFVGKTLITKAGANAIGLGIVRLRAARIGEEIVIGKRWNWETVNAGDIPADAEVSRALTRYEEEMRPFREHVGVTAVPLDAREDTVREEESNLGNLIADIMRASVNADVAILNGGSIRDDRVIPTGPVTLGDIHTLLPFSNTVVAVEVSGGLLQEVLENGVSMSGKRAGRFPQVSGFSFDFDPGALPGMRVGRITVGGRDLQPERRYSLATTDFLVERGEIDGYDMLRLPVARTGGDLNEAIIRYFRARSPVCALREGRITKTGDGEVGSKRCR